MNPYALLGAFVFASTALAQYTCPAAGLGWEVVAPLVSTNVTITELDYDGIPKKPTSSGSAEAPDNHTGDYQGSFSDTGAQGWIVSCPLADEVLGMASCTGHATADIVAGVGNASVYAGAKSEVSYGGVMADAIDEKAVAIGSAGAPVGVGGSIQMFGFGGGFNATVTPDQANAANAALSDSDTKGWKAGTSATVNINTKAYGNINLTGPACNGSISGEAKGGRRSSSARPQTIKMRKRTSSFRHPLGGSQ